MLPALLLTYFLARAATAPGLLRDNPVRLAAAHTLCDNQINVRLTFLANLSSRVSDFKRLSDTQKAQYQNQISTATTGLTTLKARCDADTDLVSLREDISSIFSVYRIYALQGPQIRLLAIGDVLGTVVDQLQSLYTALSVHVAAIGNPAGLTALLADMQSKITAASNQFSAVISILATLTPAAYNSNPSSVKTIIQTSHTDLKSGVADVKAALQDARQIRIALKSSAAVTPTVGPTP